MIINHFLGVPDRVRDDSAEKNLPLRPIFREVGGFLNKQIALVYLQGLNDLKLRNGDYLSSREATLRVLSAMKVFTTVFGMGTGGFLSLCHH